MAKGLIELGISQKSGSIYDVLHPEDEQIVRAAKFITQNACDGIEITDEFLLEYLTGLM